MIECSIGNIKIKCLIDTGSSTSLMDENKLKTYKRESLLNPLTFNSLNSKILIKNEITTELPREFSEESNMIWKLTCFKNKNFDAIIGMNILKPLNAKIDFLNDTIIINKQTIPFLNKCPFEYENIHILNISDQDDINKLSDDLNLEEKFHLNQILNKYESLFFREGDELSCTDAIKHEIITNSNRPIYSKIYRYPQCHEEEISKQISDMLSQGIIRESKSPYNSPLWIVPKKLDNSQIKKWRIVIDYRKLNEITIDDKYPMPNIDNLFDKLGKSQYFGSCQRISSNFNKRKRYPKNSFFHPFRTLRIYSDALWIKKRPSNFSKVNEYHLKRFY